MNRYTYEEIELGQTESFDVTVTEEMLDAFKGITGDVNPLHNDAEYAKERGNKDRVVYGMLTASFLSTLAGVYLPGERSLIKNTEVNFRKPVYIGDKLTVLGVVSEKNDSYNIITVKAVISNQDGEKVLKGKMEVFVW